MQEKGIDISKNISELCVILGHIPILSPRFCGSCENQQPYDYIYSYEKQLLYSCEN